MLDAVETSSVPIGLRSGLFLLRFESYQILCVFARQTLLNNIRLTLTRDVWAV